MSQHLGHLDKDVRRAVEQGDDILVNVACRVDVALLRQSGTDCGNKMSKIKVVAVL